MRTRRSLKQDRGQFGAGSRSAFTLIELMTVIGIIIVVVSLLCTALNQTRVRTLRITCLENMKQLTVVWLLYAYDNEDRVALNKSNNRGGIGMAALTSSTDSWVAGNPREDRTTAGILQGTLYPYVKNAAVYKCPLDGSTSRSGAPRTRSYSVSAYLGGDDEGVDSRVKMRLADILTPPPERVFVFIEEHPESVWAPGFLVLPRERFNPGVGAWQSTPADHHNQGCNLSFADGHLESWPWLAPKRPTTGGQLINNSRDLRDLRRLQDAVPRP